MLQSLILMSPPDFYKIREPGILGHSNMFTEISYKEFSDNSQEFKQKAHAQWETLKNIFEQAGAEVIIIDPLEDEPDFVFTADPTLSITLEDNRKVTVLSKFSNPKRLAETEAHKEFFLKNFPDREYIETEFYLEGNGDNLYDPYRDIFWSGYDPNGANLLNAQSGRSDIRAHKMLEESTGIKVISLAVHEPFFHIDTTICPLPNGHILFYKKGIIDDSITKFLEYGFDKFNLDKSEYLIEVGKEDALNFACNIRFITDKEGNITLVAPKISEKLENTIKAKGYNLITTNLSAFIASGGGAHCLSNNLNKKRQKK